jgi:hypothetical protein
LTSKSASDKPVSAHLSETAEHEIEISNYNIKDDERFVDINLK